VSDDIPAMSVTNWGVPDWRAPLGYPTALTPRQWSWEFFRRNHLYRASWELRDWDDEKSAYALWESPAHFRLSEWVDPRDGKAEPRFFYGRRFHVAVPGEHVEQVEVYPGQAAIIVDLDAPLDAQLEEAKQKIERSSRRQRLQTDLYPRYLRILDGHDAGAKDAEIAQVIYDDELARGTKTVDEARRSIKKAREAAEKLRDRDYEYLATQG